MQIQQIYYKFNQRIQSYNFSLTQYDSMLKQDISLRFVHNNQNTFKGFQNRLVINDFHPNTGVIFPKEQLNTIFRKGICVDLYVKELFFMEIYLQTLIIKSYPSQYLMLLKSQSPKVNLKKSYRKILYLYPACNNTYVFLGSVGLRQDCVTHVDAEGNQLFEHVFPVPMDSAGMISDREFIMIETRGKFYLGPENAQQNGPCITILDLETHKFRRTKHYFFNEQCDQSQIVTFADTRYLCIKEVGRYNDNRFKLSYYNYPPKENDKPFNVFDAKDGEWTYEYIVKQANQHSMVAWFKARHDQQWDFRTYDLRDDQHGNPIGYRDYRIKQQIGLPYGIANVQCALNTMWETTRGCFMMVCISNKTQEHKNQQLGVVQNNYIMDVTTGIIREAKFSFGYFQQLLIDQRNFGPTSMFRTFDFKDGKPLKTPIYYINNETEEIVAQDEWECSYLHKDEPTGVDSGMLVHNTYENGDCEWFTCETVKILNPKQISLHFMLSLNQNFDEDLMHDVVEMIDYSA